jgi:hypothetical protein
MINDLLLKSLTNFYNKGENMDILYKILTNQNKASLRLVDWFTTNYSKKHNIIYLIYMNNKDKKTLIETDKIICQFNVYNSYKSQLKAYSKKQFDPFCRRERLFFTCCDREINTTIGQLNFFKWVIVNNIMDYINTNIYDIEIDMNDSLKSIKKNYKKIDNSRKPRQELSKSAMRGLNKVPMKVSITFD